MAKEKFFVAGTDTDVGKTLVSAGLLCAAQQQGLSTLGLKPVAAGCEETVDGLRNDDAMMLQAYSTKKISYTEVNPIALKEPIAPHIAAHHSNVNLSASRIQGYIAGTLMCNRVDFTIVEGAGGWRLPLNPRESLSRVVQELKLPVILVVGMRLGCLNHALLTAEAIKADGLTIAGWVANQVDPDMLAYGENLESLKYMLTVPFVGEIPCLENPTAELAAQHLDLSVLISASG